MSARIAARPSSGPATCGGTATSMRACGPSAASCARAASAKQASWHITTACTPVSAHTSAQCAGCASPRPTPCGAIPNASTQRPWECPCVPLTQGPRRRGTKKKASRPQLGCARRGLRGRSPPVLHPRPLLPGPGLQPGAQLAPGPGKWARTPSLLVVFLSWEGVEARDLHLQVLLPCGTFLRTNRPLEAGAVAINPCLLASCVCSMMMPLLRCSVQRLHRPDRSAWDSK